MHIVNDILEFARADAGSLQLDRVTFSISESIQSTIKTFQPEIQAKNLSFQSRVDPRLPGRVCGDPTRLRHVLFNLLDNAVKFTTNGSIALILKLESVTAHEVAIRLSVADTGIGVALERQKYIFEPFRPTNPAESGPFGFNGLGLAIARKIVELMGGSMSFRVNLGQELPSPSQLHSRSWRSLCSLPIFP